MIFLGIYRPPLKNFHIYGSQVVVYLWPMMLQVPPEILSLHYPKKNDSYIMSACGGKVSLFNILTYKVYMLIYSATNPLRLMYHALI